MHAKIMLLQRKRHHEVILLLPTAWLCRFHAAYEVEVGDELLHESWGEVQAPNTGKTTHAKHIFCHSSVDAREIILHLQEQVNQAKNFLSSNPEEVMTIPL